MAKKRTRKKTGGGTTPTREMMKSIWKAIPINEWLHLLQEVAPDNKWELLNPITIKGCCPYHDDKTPSFFLTPTKSMGKCFGSCGKSVIDPISLISKLRGCNPKEGLLFLNARFNLEKLVPGLSLISIGEQHAHQEFKKACAKAFNALLNQVVRDGYTKGVVTWDYLKPLISYLKFRGIKVHNFPSLPIGAYGKPLHVKAHLDAQFHDTYDKYFASSDAEYLWGSLVFHYNDSPSTISKFKLRKISQNIDFTEWEDLDEAPDGKREAFLMKKYVYINDPFEKEIGVFGLHKYQQLIGVKDSDAYITEGEFDVLGVMVAQDEASSPDFMMFSTGGTGSTGKLGFLREYGIKTLWVVPDHPAKNGIAWAKHILSAKENFSQTIEKKPLNIKIFQWPLEITGLDLHDAIMQNDYEVMSSILYHNRKAYFKNALPWLQGLCDTELKHIVDKYAKAVSELDVNGKAYTLEKTNLLDEKASALLQQILYWFEYIIDQGDKIAFSQKYAAEYNIDVAKIKEVRDSIHATHTMQGVVEAIGNNFEDTFEFAYYEPKATGIVMYLWHKRKKEIIPIKMTDANLFNLVSNYLGGSIPEWVERILGENPILMDGTEDLTAMAAYNKKRTNAKTILLEAIEQRQGKADSIHNLRVITQGIHMEDISNEAKQKGHIYFVNGSHIMRGTYDQNGDLNWVEFDKVTDENMRFATINKAHQWSSVTEISDLDQANKVDHKQIYASLVDILNGWKFENHDIMVQYLAAYIMSIPVMNAISDVNITLITGSAESGKTSLTHGLLGGVGTLHQCPTVLESVRYFVDASPASIYQKMDRCTLCFILDEAESGKENNTNKDQRNREIMRMMYAIPQGGMMVNRGGQTQERQVDYFLRMPVIMAAISVPTDPTFLSRTLIVYTEKDPGRIDPAVYIQDKYTNNEIATIRKNITIGLLPKIPMLKRRVKELAKQLTSKSKTISNRFVNSIIVPLTVFEMIGGDPEWLYSEIYDKYKHRLEAIHSNTANSSLINACLYGEGVKIINAENIHLSVPPKQLILGNDMHVLNNSECGVYYSVNRDLIVIVWRQVKHTILKGTFYASSGESVLREQASKVPEVLGDISDHIHNSIIKELGLRDVKKQTDYTLLDVSYLLGNKKDFGFGPPSLPGHSTMADLDLATAKAEAETIGSVATEGIRGVEDIERIEDIEDVDINAKVEEVLEPEVKGIQRKAKGNITKEALSLTEVDEDEPLLDESIENFFNVTNSKVGIS